MERKNWATHMLYLTWAGNCHCNMKINHCGLDSETSLNAIAKLRLCDSFSPI